MLSSKVNTSTKMYGVIGDPIKHSKSPLMLNRAFQEMKINAIYGAFHVETHQLKEAMEGLRAFKLGGLNVTIPHKVEVMSYIDEIDEGAKVIGAVNTIVNDNGKLVGYNTDGIGYVRSLKEETELDLTGKRILILGAGGAARGVAYALSGESPEHIWIANRTTERATELAESMQPYVQATGMGISDITKINNDVDLVINTTSVGMHPQVDYSPIPSLFIKENMVFSDLIYNPRKTKLLSLAEEKGCQIHSGLGMFIYQGAYAFEYWTGKPAPIEAMKQVMEY
ncbi:shikimate dehydrogenase [Chengkuizengella axinellae]|uniref:Shikimate dehydrogenase (NADP(+)) n=1 Tax=Chengkuizengella axinellae TaxID=3064388 RepID=A0ABT9IW64_9BACL|nr:shikimate dehydrogenase [Chengkuizengella sp. 2205SS18-9]MDP5273030.1 shikimate dehydrogenase [Chengkuizengella sp. 2205SS18-9]